MVKLFFIKPWHAPQDIALLIHDTHSLFMPQMRLRMPCILYYAFLTKETLEDTLFEETQEAVETWITTRRSPPACPHRPPLTRPTARDM